MKNYNLLRFFFQTRIVIDKPIYIPAQVTLIQNLKFKLHCSGNIIPIAFFHSMVGFGEPVVRQSRDTEFFKITKESPGSITQRGGTEIQKWANHLHSTLKFDSN